MKTKILTLAVVAIFSQYKAQFDIDKQGLIEREKRAFTKKMPVGNTNPNTQNYDLQYQRLDLTLDPGVYYVSGSVTSHFTPKQNISSIYFDLTNQLTVSQVIKNGVSLNFQQLPTKEIKIDFPSSLPENVKDSLTIHYSGAPATTYSAFGVHTQGSNPVMSTLSEPYGAQDWFPTKQSLDDKIEAFDFKITTPAQYSVAANGLLMSETLLPNSQKLTFWRTQYPMAAYLAAFSITNFVKTTSTIGNPPFPYINYLYPSSSTNAAIMANIEWTKQAMSVFETYFGEYPFRNEKYGHMEFGHTGICMEHQTMSSMSSWGKAVIAHELAHQWFGDKVTCGTWNDIWLNEGFASFGEHLVNEKLLMNASEFKNYLQGLKNNITSLPGGSTYVPDAYLNSINAIFSSRLTYTKGGYIVRMIKWILGDDAFYQAIKDYHSRQNLAYNYAVTSDLKNSLLLSTNIDFTEFFNDWVYGEGYPIYTLKWKQAPNMNLILKVSQAQSSQAVNFFEMPLPIKVVGTSGQIAYLKLNNTINDQYYTEAVPFPIANIEFNYENQIIEKNSTVIQDNSLDVKEFEKDRFEIYPNPTSGLLHLKGITRKIDFEIYHSDGRLLNKGIYLPNKPIDLNKLVKGVYFIHINEKKIKFIKK